MGREKTVQIQLAKRLGEAGKREYRIGRSQADVVTEFEIIEVKDIRSWKNAIGQLLYYQAKSGMYHKTLRLHLFGECSDEEWFYITTICSRLNILVTREEEVHLIAQENCCDTQLSRLCDFEIALDSMDLELQELKKTIWMLDKQHSALATEINYSLLKLDKLEVHLSDYLDQILTSSLNLQRGHATIKAEVDIAQLAFSQSTLDILNKIANSLCPD